MEKMRKFGLVGRNISYSFSQKYFTEKFKKLLLNNHSYEVFDIAEIGEINHVFDTEDLCGFNVTIPYKETIIPHLDELSDEAKNIGAVNTVHLKDGKKTGYNTDAYGFEKTLLVHKKPHHQSALILGDGGAAKAVRYVLDKHGISHKTVARKLKLNFDNLTPDLVNNHHLIIQTTPVGTFPNTDACINFPFEALGEKHLIIDLIYNPEYTTFIKKAAEKGAKCANGYFMLEQQAEKAWEIWNFQ